MRLITATTPARTNYQIGMPGQYWFSQMRNVLRVMRTIGIHKYDDLVRCRHRPYTNRFAFAAFVILDYANAVALRNLDRSIY